MFDRIEPAPLRLALERERTARLQSTPTSAYTYADVTWTAAGERDIAHGLPNTGAPVRWVPVMTTAPMRLSQNPAGTPATATTIYLTSDAAGTARLLLFLEA